MESGNSPQPPKAPYPPAFWALGGPPVKRVDIPAQAIFMFLFIIGSIVHMKIFQGNRGRGHKFLPNLFIFFFCMSRVVTSIIRIASVSLPKIVQLALAAQVLVAAGVIILFIINLIFAIRIVRSTHRSFGWHPVFDILSKFIFLVLGATIILLIAATIQSSYTLNPKIHALDRTFQLYGTTALAIAAILPLPMLALTLLIPYSPLDEFGTGRLRTKVIALLVSTTLLSIGAWYRCGASWQPPVPRSQPLPRYLGKPPFYILNFLFEFQTVMMYAILRVDQRFHIPDGAHGPGSYSRPARAADVEMQDSRPTSATASVAATSSTGTLVSGKEALSDSRTQLDVIVEMSEKQDDNNDDEHHPPVPQLPPKLLSPPPSRPTSSRPHSLLQHVLTRSTTTTTTKPSREQKRQWRESEEARIVTRLGGPWSRLPSPTESTFSYAHTPSPTRSTFSSSEGVTAGAGLSFGGSSSSRRSRTGRDRGDGEDELQGDELEETENGPPSLRDTLHMDGGWTPEIEWELASPKRFLSLKKRSMMFLK